MPLFACRNLTRRPWFAARELSLDVGEIVVLSGPSGSGKTLFLRALADLDPVDSGQVLIGGVDRNELAAAEYRRRVVYVHQSSVGLAGTVRQDLNKILALSGTPAATALPGTLPLERETEHLSGGESQRVALERALLVRPDVLLLDEPSSALDDAAARALEHRVSTWVADGHGAIWISHDLGLAERLGARWIRLE